MTIDIEELRALHAATTQGEWKTASGMYGYPVIWANAVLCVAHIRGIFEWESNGIFIAAAHEVMPSLLDEIENLRKAFREAICEMREKTTEQTIEIERLQTQVTALSCDSVMANKLLKESQNNDRIAMAWIADIKVAAGYEGDMPGLVKEIERLRDEIARLKAEINFAANLSSAAQNMAEEANNEIERLRKELGRYKQILPNGV